jgi:ribose transport system substrate-binding protein
MTRSRAFATITVLSLALFAGGCGSDAAGGNTTGGTGETSASVVDAAKKATEAALTEPTVINMETPLPSAPEPGKTVVFLSCDNPNCPPFAEGMKEAADAVGWNLEEIPYKLADPSTLISAFHRALNYDPAAVVLTGMPAAVWTSVLPDYQEAGVPIIPMVLGPVGVKDPVVANIGGPRAWIGYGTTLADWFIADSDGTGHALVANLTEFPLNVEIGDGISQKVAECKGCKVTDLTLTLTQLTNGEIPKTIAAQVRRDPSIDYVLATNGQFVDTLPEAFKSVGVTDVKIATTTASATTLDLIADGTIAAGTTLGSRYEGWMAIDAAIRHSMGLEQEPLLEDGSPSRLVTEAESLDADAVDPSGSYDVPLDYADQFKALWQVG